MIVPDLNLIIFAHNCTAPDHDRARAWWESVINGNEAVGIPWVVSTGFVRLMTHPKILKQPIDTDFAVDRVEEWMSFGHVQPLHPGGRHLEIFRGLLQDAQVGGNFVTDAHIAAVAVEYNATVYSNDLDFGRFSGLKWVNPLS